MSRRRSTIDDVARAASVARVTVSRVLNNVPNVLPETRERVHRAIDALGYSVNPRARALASGTSRQIVLVHVQDTDREPNSYYHAGLELGALRGCSASGFELVTRSVESSANDSRGWLKALVERDHPAGIVVSPPLSDDIELLSEANTLGVRVVAISAGEETRELVAAVGIDERAAGRAVAAHLLALGHRRLGFLKGPQEHRAAALRFDGFVDALRDGGIVEEPWTAVGDFTFKSGVEGAERLLHQAPGVTGLACANDDMAAGAMLALHRAGVAIPHRMSVTGFDDTPMSEVIWPPLTTVRQPIKLMAERAVQLLVAADPQSSGAPEHEIIAHELVVRDSTATVSEPAAA